MGLQKDKTEMAFQIAKLWEKLRDFLHRLDRDGLPPSRVKEVVEYRCLRRYRGDPSCPSVKATVPESPRARGSILREKFGYTPTPARG
jgi:hypothetical protein